MAFETVRAVGTPPVSRMFAPLASRSFAKDGPRSMSLAKIDATNNMAWAFDLRSIGAPTTGNSNRPLVTPSGVVLLPVISSTTGPLIYTLSIYRNTTSADEDCTHLFDYTMGSTERPISAPGGVWLACDDDLIYAYTDFSGGVKMTALDYTGSVVWQTAWVPDGDFLLPGYFDGANIVQFQLAADCVASIDVTSGVRTLGPAGIRNDLINWGTITISPPEALSARVTMIPVGYSAGDTFWINSLKSNFGQYYNFGTTSGGVVNGAYRIFPDPAYVVGFDFNCPTFDNVVRLSGGDFVADGQYVDFPFALPTVTKTMRFFTADPGVWIATRLPDRGGRAAVGAGWSSLGEGIEIPDRSRIYRFNGDGTLATNSLITSVIPAGINSDGTAAYVSGQQSPFYEWQPPL